MGAMPHNWSVNTDAHARPLASLAPGVVAGYVGRYAA